MAITRRWQTGWETGNAHEISDPKDNSVIGGGRTGAYQMRIYPYDSTTRRNVYQTVAATRQIRAGYTLDPLSFWGNLDAEILSVRNGTTRILEVGHIQATNEFELIIDGSQEDVTSGLNPALSTWHYITIDCKVDSSSGWAKVYHNSIEILSFTGDTGNIDIDNFLFGSISDSGANICEWHLDDLYIDDTTGESIPTGSPPILRFYYIYPNATGNYDQWVGSDANNVDNWALVDERPSGTADYVEEDTVDQFDSYAMTTFALSANQTIEALIPIVYAQRYGASEEIAIGTRYSGADVIGSDQDPGFGAWSFSWERQTTKPGGGAWTQAAMDAVEAVIKSRGSF